MKFSDDMKFTVRMEYFEYHNGIRYFTDGETTGVPFFYVENTCRKLAEKLNDEESLIQFSIFPDYPEQE